MEKTSIQRDIHTKEIYTHTRPIHIRGYAHVGRYTQRDISTEGHMYERNAHEAEMRGEGLYMEGHTQGGYIGRDMHTKKACARRDTYIKGRIYGGDIHMDRHKHGKTNM